MKNNYLERRLEEFDKKFVINKCEDIDYSIEEEENEVF